MGLVFEFVLHGKLLNCFYANLIGNSENIILCRVTRGSVCSMYGKGKLCMYESHRQGLRAGHAGGGYMHVQLLV